MIVTKHQKAPKPKLILFVGPGNSGSTSIGLKTANDENGIFVGESLQLLFRKKVYCRCGQEASYCEHIEFLKPLSLEVKEAERRGHLNRVLCWIKMGKVVLANKDLVHHCQRLANISGVPIIDSSKDFLLAIVACSLSRSGDFDLKIEFPRRSMVEYLKSCKKRFPAGTRIGFALRYYRLTALGYFAYFYAKLHKIESSVYFVQSLETGLFINKKTKIDNEQLKILSDKHYISGSSRLSKLLDKAKQ